MPPSDGSADEVVLDVSEPDGVRSKKKSSLIKKAKEIETKQLQATAESGMAYEMIGKSIHRTLLLRSIFQSSICTEQFGV